MENRRKRILFTVLEMNVGGVEKALLSLLKALEPYDFEVHLAMIRPEGGFMNSVPGYVKVHEIKGFGREPGLTFKPKKEIVNRLKGLQWSTGIPAAFHYGRSVLSGSLHPFLKWMLRNDRPGRKNADDDLDREFDLAVDFPGPPGEHLEYYVAHHVKARKRAAWIHFDLRKIHMRKRSSYDVYHRMDRVFCVSDVNCAQFRSMFPKEASKAVVFHNLVNEDMVRWGAAESSEFDPKPGALNIVQVGRLSGEKGQTTTLKALKILKDRGIPAYAHFVGDGAGRAELQALATELGLEGDCRFYGNQSNPYPFMAGSDVFVQPSLHEGLPITVEEAKALGAPIVASAYQSAREQLGGVKNAVIADMYAAGADSAQVLADAIRQANALGRTDGATDPGRSAEIERFLDLLRD